MKDIKETKMAEEPSKGNMELTDAVIAEFKKKWGKVYKTEIDGEAYVWRKIRRKEYVDIMLLNNVADEGVMDDSGMATLYNRQEQITRMVVLFPEDIEEKLIANGGLATVISDEVLLKSGFEMTKETEEL